MMAGIPKYEVAMQSIKRQVVESEEDEEDMSKMKESLEDTMRTI
jgi:hypothetical protein